jgi:hypothetical protein
VCCVDQLFQIVWEAISAACRKEAVDLVAEASIVCMLHNRHQLYGIVAQVLDAGEDVVRELFVCSNSRLGGGDTDVGFVDTGALGLRRSLVLPDVLLRGIPEARIVDGGDAELLGDTGDPGWEALLTGPVIGNDEGYLYRLCQLHCGALV